MRIDAPLYFGNSRTVADVERELEQAGVELHLAAVRRPVQNVPRRTRLWDELVEAGRVHPTVADAVDALPSAHPALTPRSKRS